MKHNNLESGFIKGATEFGVEADCVKGYIKQAEQTYDFCCGVIDQAEKNSKDPGFRQKLAFELLCANMNPEIIKTALEDKRGNELMEMLGQLFGGQNGEVGGGLRGMFNRGADGLGEMLGQRKGEGAGGLGGAIMGAGGGALSGLLISKLLNINPLIGMLLMGALGGGAGHHFGKNPAQAKTTMTPNGETSTEGTSAAAFNDVPGMGVGADGKPSSQMHGAEQQVLTNGVDQHGETPHSITPPGQPHPVLSQPAIPPGLLEAEVGNAASQTPAIPTPAPGAAMQAEPPNPTPSRRKLLGSPNPLLGPESSRGERGPLSPGDSPRSEVMPGVNNAEGGIGEPKTQTASNAGINNKPHMPQAGPVPGAGFDYKPMPTAQV